jgi:predicted transposase YdaD
VVTVPDDYDSPWKEAIETLLPECLELFFPEAHQAIDWTKPVAFLDQELRSVQREAEIGLQIVDKLVQVYLRDGSDIWVLLHLEVQNQPDPNFPQRMFTYYYRLHDRFNRPIASFAILGVERSSWHPDRYETSLWGSSIRFVYQTIKLLDYRKNLEHLAANRNPFATIVLAHLATQETHGNPAARLRAKIAALRRLYAFDYNREQIVRLYRLVDWFLVLPPELTRQFREEVARLEQEEKVPYISSIERLGREEGLHEGLAKGRQEGRQEGIREGILEAISIGLTAKFGTTDQELVAEIGQVTDLDILRSIQRALITASTIDDVRQVYR